MRRLTSRGRLPRLVAGFAAILLAFTSSLPAHPAAAAGQPLRYVGGEPATMDPAFIDSAGDVQFLLQLYAGLTRLDEEGRPYASLAEWWSLSADGRTYTFRLRSGQGDLRHLAHLGGPPAQGLDELSEGEAACRLRPKAVVVGRLHGPVY